MEKATIIGIVLAVFLVAGAVIGSAAFMGDDAVKAVKTVQPEKSVSSCPCGCGGNCGGNCGAEGCNCAKSASVTADKASCGASGCGGTCGGKCGAAGCGCAGSS